jgi:hypothetical protein
MIIYCTQKLAKKMSEVSAAPLAETSLLGSWIANLYTIDRRRCVLFCHDETRYVLFAAGLRKVQCEELGLLHRQLFVDSWGKEGVAETQLKKVALALGPVRFDRATDRSVLGSMNVVLFDLVLHLECLADSRDEDTMKAVLTVNERPATVRGKVIWPDKAMLQRTALF